MNHPYSNSPSGKKRARSLGIPFEGTPGANNSITDVHGVEVGYSTIIRGEGPLVVGQGPVRTGVTAILPRGRSGAAMPVFAGYFAHNGAGEMTGTIGIEEFGLFDGPVMITNTHSVGVVRDAAARWIVEHAGAALKPWYLPVVAETFDGYLNDCNGFHVKEKHAIEAIESARGGRIDEGSVGGGTGMISYEFKAGSGTSSRVVETSGGRYTVGVFVQANFGVRAQFTVAGVPVGRHITEGTWRHQDLGSIIAVVATDAPLLPHQAKRLARRVSMGLARSGSTSGDGSGDIFLAFSTANAMACSNSETVVAAEFLPNDVLNPVFTAVVRATDEAIINSIVANETMTGRDGHTVIGLPHEQLQEVLKKYGRLGN